MAVPQHTQNEHGVRADERERHQDINQRVVQHIHAHFAAGRIKDILEIVDQHIQVAHRPAGTLLEPNPHAKRLLLPRHRLRHKFDFVAHAVDAEADFRVLRQRVRIPAADFLNDVAVHDEVRARNGAQSEVEPSPRLIHALVRQRLDVDKAREERSVSIACAEFADDRAQRRIAHQILHQNAQRLRFGRVVRVVNRKYTAFCNRIANVERVGLPFPADNVIRIDDNQVAAGIRRLNLLEHICGVISGVVVDDDDFVAVVRVVEVEQGADGAPNDDALVVRRHHYRHERVLVNRHMPVRFAALMIVQESADGQKDVNRHQRPDADHRNQHQVISRRHADSPPPARLSRADGCPAAAAASSAGK